MLRDILIRVKLLFSKDKELYKFCKSLLGFYPRDISLYKTAFAHRSHTVTVGKGRRVNNERLEFLGDSILDSIVAHLLYERYPRAREGFLTSTRSKIVKRESLNALGEKLRLRQVVQWQQTHNTHNNYVLGNAVEALIGAVYLDQGYRRCFRFVKERLIRPYFNLRKLTHTESNFKSHVIEWCQKYHVSQEFRTTCIQSEGGSEPTFTTTVLIAGTEVGTGTGYTKKESHQQASKAAIKALEANESLRDMLMMAHNAESDEQADTIRAEIDKETLISEAEAKAHEQEARERERASEQADFGDTDI